ncbi:endonuclease [Candidatus Berkelbacteria bacterium]|nr:endonuclease [Candidatus Berkelbacteria bacterium]
MDTTILILLGIIAGLLFMLWLFFQLWQSAGRRLRQVSFQKVSLSTKYGKMSEQFMPFLKDYPYDPQQFRFIGTPIDGIQFTEDTVVFVEFKAADSALNPTQKHIKELIENKRVEWLEFRIK